jgi:hypothetical protein
MRGILAVVACGLAATACVDTSERISSELVKAGLDQQRAQCVGQRLERDLSLNQLRQLANAARAYRSNDSTPGRLTGSDLLRASAQVSDPAVTVAVAKAAAACA